MNILRRCCCRNRELFAGASAHLVDVETPLTDRGQCGVQDPIPAILHACNRIRQLSLSDEAKRLVDSIDESAQALQNEIIGANLGCPVDCNGRWPTSEEQADWHNICSQGGRLWSILQCIEVVDEQYTIGRLFVGEYGLFIEMLDDEYSHREVMRWGEIEKVERSHDDSADAAQRVIVRVKATFAFNGKMGVVCADDGTVQEVIREAPADTSGIRAGHRIIKVDTNPYSKEKLMIAENTRSDFQVTVRTDPWQLRMVTPSDATWLLQAWTHAPKTVHGLVAAGQIAAGLDARRHACSFSSLSSLQGSTPEAGEATSPDCLTMSTFDFSSAKPALEKQIQGLTLEEVQASYETEPFIYQVVLQESPFTCADFHPTPWVMSTKVPGSKERRLSFQKPLSKMQASFSKGATHAACTAMYRMQRHGNSLEILQRTTSTGPPYTDCFWVAARTVFSAHPSGVTFMIYVNVEWTKEPRMWGVKSIVENAACDESKLTGVQIVEVLRKSALR